MADSNVFALKLTEFVERAKAAPEQVVRRATLDVAQRIIERSPVDTGRFRANWNVAFGRIDTLTTPSTDKKGDRAKERIRIQLNGWNAEAGDIYLTNSLPYAIPLEYGHSKNQAPLGMVRVTVTEWNSYIEAAAIKERAK